ncbi:hypothetical protein EU91_0004 [Prochlorococcus marinus str. GP2]|uniref:Uncharacterized protein n=1 Tax=Prochlorococcus marinus str. GP2 TaxID=59925 RepID=A0A0A1ZLL3_PROMR|nr:hypothetical protein EU91_0004 [Prochlorococcus marinus str. GP2]
MIQYSLRVNLITLSVVGISGGVSCLIPNIVFWISYKNN